MFVVRPIKSVVFQVSHIFVYHGQIDLHQARQSIEQHESPENIFSSVLETAAQAYGEDDSIQGMVAELASDQELTDVCFLHRFSCTINV